MVKYSYICTIRPTLRARHIGESVMLSSPHGNLVNFELDGDAASTLTAWYSHAATCCGEYTSVGLLFVTSKGFTRASMRLQAQAPHFPFTNPADLNRSLRKAKNNFTTMKGKNVFTKSECDALSKLITQRCAAPRNRQKTIRDQMRAIGFYGRDDFGITGMTVEIFDGLIRDGKITIKG